MQPTPTELVQWLERLSDLGFGTLVLLILFGNFYGIWVWGRLHREQIAAKEADRSKVEAEKDEWKDMALGLLNPLEETLKRKRG
jgi:hypothetical protein